MGRGSKKNKLCPYGSNKKYKKCHEPQDSMYYNRNAVIIGQNKQRNKYDNYTVSKTQF